MDTDIVRVEARLLMKFLSSMTFNLETGEGAVSRQSVRELYNAILPISQDDRKGIYLDETGRIYIWHNEDGTLVKKSILLSGIAYRITVHLIKNDCASLWDLTQYSLGKKPDLVIRTTITKINKQLVDYGHGIESIGGGIYRIF